MGKCSSTILEYAEIRGVCKMTVPEMIILVKQALQMAMDLGQTNTNIVIEIRRGEPRNVRFDVDVKPSYKDAEDN